MCGPCNGRDVRCPSWCPARSLDWESRHLGGGGSAGRLAPPLGTKHEALTGTAAILAAHGRRLPPAAKFFSEISSTPLRAVRGFGTLAPSADEPGSRKERDDLVFLGG